MSKCDLRIVFDRTDRTYCGGEAVTGKVHVRVNEVVRSTGITLTHQWRTHGRGNTTSGPKETVQLAAECTYSPGEEVELPFSVTAASHPVTYRGNLINVDHYVSVQVNVPWAFNPKKEEEYLLKPGEPPAGFAGTRDAIITLKQNSAGVPLIGKIILGIILCAVLIPVIMFAAFLLPIILLIAGIVWFRRKALSRRLGEVQLSIPHVVVAPGEQWTARIQFTPRKQFRINSIGLTLLGKETATSGSGTKSTTHNHTILEQKLVVRSNDMLAANELVSEEFRLEFPATTAYSADLPDNKIQWTAAVRIDIPAFPDWSKTLPIQVVPESFLKNVSPVQSVKVVQDQGARSSQPYVASPPAIDRGLASSDMNYHDAEDDNDDSSTTTDENEASSASLLQLVDAISRLPRHANERSDIVTNASGAVFDAVVIVDRVSSSVGTVNSDPRYEYGKSITGTIQGTNQAIQVITPEALNDDIDELRRGDIWPVQVSLLNWDNLYNRINARQADENA